VKSSKRSLVSPSVIATLLVLLILTTGCSSLGGTSLADESLTLSVVGYGQATGVPDLANIQLGVSLVDEDLGEVIDEGNATIQDITDALLAEGLGELDVRTTNYSLWREDIYDPNTGMPTGDIRYHIDISLELTIREVDQIGEFVAVGLDAGANNVYGISFAIEDTAALEAEARSEAIADVKERAEQIAKGLGMSLGDPISVGEGVAGAPGPVYNYGLKGEVVGLGGGGGGAAISPGQTTIVMQVNVIYELLP
jgi:uncharacterized protein YggE